jgi:hypothetical protein
MSIAPSLDRMNVQRGRKNGCTCKISDLPLEGGNAKHPRSSTKAFDTLAQNVCRALLSRAVLLLGTPKQACLQQQLAVDRLAPVMDAGRAGLRAGGERQEADR